MAKKNKKNVKINHKIKKYFDDDPFDVGVQRVDSHTLSELIHTLGIYDIEHSKKEILRTIRMLWSEANSGLREDILNFFEANNVIYYSDTPKQKNISVDDKIDELLLELDTTHEEDTLLREMFIGVRSKKITIPKLESKLQHIRFEAKKVLLEKQLEGVFDIYDTFEFNASIKYDIFGKTFFKILTLNTKPYQYEFLQESSEEKIIQKITQDKLTAIAHKQKLVDSFIQNLEIPHTYLSDKEITTALKASPPKSKLSYPLLKLDILESLCGISLDIVEIELLEMEVLLKISQIYQFPYSDIKIDYILDIHIDLNSLLENIWLSKELDFSDVVDKAKSSHESLFVEELESLVKECGDYASLLHLSNEELHQKIYIYLQPLLPKSLHITSKVKRKCLRTFIYNIHEQIIKKQRHALLARTIRDFKNLFPIARDMRRKLTLHIGPTNSGKTYQAMQKLQEGDTGYYLAPLRLLALEGYETLKSKGLDSSLITGEEQILNEDATHISSTIEMLNFDVDVDVCVIDEVQMIADPDRGWAWANAIIGAPAKEIIMTGSTNSKDAIIALAQYLGEELEIIEFERKNQLTVLESITKQDDVEAQTAIIAFSRKDVLRLKQNFSKDFNVSVVYGNLSPEVRREEARRFREGETDILVATDAIAMGMNLPIKTILFSKAQKFDGFKQRNLKPSEVHQISGRAGRYGLSEEGFVGAFDNETLKIIKKNFSKPADKITIPFKVMANLEHIKLVGNILEENSLQEILKFFVENMQFNGPFRASNLDDMLEASKIVDRYHIDIATKYHLACAPLTLKSPYIISAFENYIYALERDEIVSYNPPTLRGRFAQTADDLLKAEDMIKEISLYLWLSYRFTDNFLDEQKARMTRGVINKYIEESLQQTQLAKRCKLCGAILPLNSKHEICDRCFKKHYRKRGYRK